MKRLVAIALVLLLMLPQAAAYELTLNAKSVILMEAETGTVLYESNADEALPPASVTKVMTLLLVMEAIEQGAISLDDVVSVSENAAGMGGSQIFLEPYEKMSVDELLKSVVIASANDAATALAEHVSGSVEGFVGRMNERARELGAKNTVFENPTGLDDNTVTHLTSARDIAIMSRELMRHKKVFEYTTVWMDTVRDGKFGLTNTNRLIRFYSGANGLKTGSTSKAGFCISATAKRNGMQLIAVIMASPTRDIRNETAKKLLDFGFANFNYFCFEEGALDNVRVLGGVSDSCPAVYGKFDVVLEKKQGTNIEKTVNIQNEIAAPVAAGQILGTVEYTVGGETLGTVDILAGESVERLGFSGRFIRMLRIFTAA